MELLTKAEKCNATILCMRKLNENLNFQSYKISYEEYNRNVTPAYRDAPDYYEKSLYPQTNFIFNKIYKIRQGILSSLNKRR